MKARIQSSNRQLTLEVEGATQKDLFAELASAQEVFDVGECGACHGEARLGTRFQVRVVMKGTKRYDFFEHVCRDPKCRARFSMGQSTSGDTLFPKRKDNEGNWLPNGGWVKYSSGQSEHSDANEWES